MAREFRRSSKDTLWLDVLVAMEHQSLGTGKTTGNTSTTVGPSNTGRATIIRVRGNYIFLLDPSAANDAKTVALGLIVATASAVVAGVASLPGPISDPDAKWLWVVYHNLLSGDATTQSGADINQAVRGVIDTKAMRRTNTNDNLVFVGEATNQGGTPTVQLGGVARVLILEG